MFVATFNKFLTWIDAVGSIVHFVQDFQITSGATSDIKDFAFLIEGLLEVIRYSAIDTIILVGKSRGVAVVIF
ncbi:MAG: hypothetical protein A2X45_11605 [Lentisphaerae bacterium GWF2_50_93]|nr:MAG: hypothetical protein A2X45_11605 [Lentisphaerae bacterium GWF2_50_93]